jgi:hypothetical protein
VPIDYGIRAFHAPAALGERARATIAAYLGEDLAEEAST